MKYEFDKVYYSTKSQREANRIFRGLMDAGIKVEEKFNCMVGKFYCYRYTLVFSKEMKSVVFDNINQLCFPEIKVENKSLLDSLFKGGLRK